MPDLQPSVWYSWPFLDLTKLLPTFRSKVPSGKPVGPTSAISEVFSANDPFEKDRLLAQEPGNWVREVPESKHAHVRRWERENSIPGGAFEGERQRGAT